MHEPLTNIMAGATMTDPKNVGFIGLGLMGHGMAKNLLRHGHRLAVVGHRNRAPLEHLLAQGATEAASPAELASHCDVVFTCLPSSRDVEEVVYGPNGLLENGRPDLVHIDSTTALPESSVRIAADYNNRQIHFIDAPLARDPEAAEAGKLNLIVGSDQRLLDRVRPLLLCFAENIFHMGDVGSGHRAKLINNFISMGMASLIADALTAARVTGVELGKLHALISAGGVNSPMFQTMALAAMDGDNTRLKFSIANARKDINYFNRTVNDAGMVSFFAPAVLQALTLAERQGRASAFVPSLSQVLRAINEPRR